MADSTPDPGPAAPRPAPVPPQDVQGTQDVQDAFDPPQPVDGTGGFADLAEPDSAPDERRRGVVGSAFAGIRRLLSVTVFASLTRRIVVLNLAAMVALVAAILYLNTWRAGLIDVRVQSLRVQGEIIAAAIAASATVDSDVILVDPDRLLQLQTNANSPLGLPSPGLEFPINPERAAPLLETLVTPTATRARIYDTSGLQILDSASFNSGVDDQPAAAEPQPEFVLTAWWNEFFRGLRAGEYALYQEHPGDQGLKYPEVVSALQTGKPAAFTRVDEASRLIVSVAIPIKQINNAVVSVLLLSTNPGDIDQIVESERWGILRVFVVAMAVTFLLSLLMAGTIAGPVRRLSAAAKRVQTSISEREQIPDFSERSDEIGDLSASIRGMTNALYSRIEAIERFAADVAHELKNPLTSLRSAVETLPRARTEGDRTRLADIIKHDVRRVDRLISDISSASRLDAELAREGTEIVDLRRLLETIVAIQNDVAAGHGVAVRMIAPDGPAPTVRGQDSRLAQVFTNLVDNAISFSPAGTTVSVKLNVHPATVCVDVIDEGPGIRGDVSRVFSRFYTDRPEAQGFGNHSGLGLSISRQIVESHKGKVEAFNRKGASGAIFAVTLPRASH